MAARRLTCMAGRGASLKRPGDRERSVKNAMSKTAKQSMVWGGILILGGVLLLLDPEHGKGMSFVIRRNGYWYSYELSPVPPFILPMERGGPGPPQCRSNLRQIGLALTIYARDHAGWGPRSNGLRGSPRMTAWRRGVAS